MDILQLQEFFVVNKSIHYIKFFRKNRFQLKNRNLSKIKSENKISLKKVFEYISFIKYAKFLEINSNFG